MRPFLGIGGSGLPTTTREGALFSLSLARRRFLAGCCHGRTLSLGSTLCVVALVGCKSPPHVAAAPSPTRVSSVSPSVPPPEVKADRSEESQPEPAWRYQGPVISGVDCAELGDQLPNWLLDSEREQVGLSNGSSTFIALPPGWQAELEQARLLVLRGPKEPGRFRSTFELLLGPRCARVDGSAIHARVAARAWAEVQPPEVTLRAVRDGRWSAGLGGIGKSLILEVKQETPAGSETASLYFTEYGRAKSFVIYAAAACPGPVPPVATEGPCQRAFRALVE